MKSIGRIAGSKGLNGELKITFFMELEWDEMHSIFIEKSNESYIPYTVEYISDSGQAPLKKTVKLEEVNNKEEADALSKKYIYLQETEYEEILPLDSWYRLMDYEIYDKENLIGKIGNIIENAQVLFLIQSEAKEIMIPYVEEWIEDLDEKNKVIKMNLPDGILDIND